MRDNRKNYKSNYSNVLSVSEISWIDKHLFEVEEAQLNYFLLTQHSTSKHIDLARIDTKSTDLKDIVLLGNRMIGVKFIYTNQYVIMDQKDFTMLDKVLKYTKLRMITSCEEGEQYFLADKKEHPKPFGVIKVAADGEISLLYARIWEHVERVVQTFLNLGDSFAINYDRRFTCFAQNDQQCIVVLFVYNKATVDKDKPEAISLIGQTRRIRVTELD